MPDTYAIEYVPNLLVFHDAQTASPDTARLVLIRQSFTNAINGKPILKFSFASYHEGLGWNYLSAQLKGVMDWCELPEPIEETTDETTPTEPKAVKK